MTHNLGTFLQMCLPRYYLLSQISSVENTVPSLAYCLYGDFYFLPPNRYRFLGAPRSGFLESSLMAPLEFCPHYGIVCPALCRLNDNLIMV